ncbi:MAG: pitrilysin family protein, partial [Woeseia sp.]
MSSRLPLLAFALLLSQAATAELNLAGASQHTLDNGLTVLILEEHSFPLVSVQMLYRAGARDEVPGRTGLAHFLEHMAFRGSEHFPDTGLVSSIYAAGGEWHGYTWIDQTTYFATAPVAELDLLLDIEADRMARLDIAAADIPAERGAVLAEMNGYENDISAVLHDASIFAALVAHPYRNNTIGWASDVRSITSDDVSAFYAQHYHPGNAVLAIVGDVDSEAVLTSVKQRFAGLPGHASTPLPVTVEPAQQGERRVRLERPAARKHFQLVWQAPSAVSADYAAFLLLQELLGASSGVNFLQNDWGTPARPGSLLHGISDDIKSWFIPTAQPYVFTISGSIANDGDETELENAIDAALIAAAEQPVEAEHFAAARQRLLDQLLLDVQTTEDAAHQLAFFAGIDALDTLLSLQARVEALEPADIQRVTKRYLSTQQRTIAWGVDGVGPRSPRVAAPAEKLAVEKVAINSTAAPAPRILHLDNGTPVIVQESGLSATLHLTTILRGRYTSDDSALSNDSPINGRSAFSLTATNREQHALIQRAATALRNARPESAATA